MHAGPTERGRISRLCDSLYEAMELSLRRRLDAADHHTRRTDLRCALSDHIGHLVTAKRALEPFFCGG